jgi:hypothetical protein
MTPIARYGCSRVPRSARCSKHSPGGHPTDVECGCSTRFPRCCCARRWTLRQAHLNARLRSAVHIEGGYEKKAITSLPDHSQVIVFPPVIPVTGFLLGLGLEWLMPIGPVITGPVPGRSFPHGAMMLKAGERRGGCFAKEVNASLANQLRLHNSFQRD